MAMSRGVNQLGPMALAVVSLSIIVGIGAIVLAELGSLSIVNNDTTADNTISAGADALGTFGDFFTVIDSNQRSPLQATASTKKDTICWNTPAKPETARFEDWGNQQETEQQVQDPQRRYVSTHETLGSDFVQPFEKSRGVQAL